MDNFKRFITATIAAFMVLSMPLLVHASDNSIKTLPAEGNVQCSDYAANKVIESMSGNVPAVGDTVMYTGPNNSNDPDTSGGEEVYVTLDTLTTLSFANATTPIDYALLKSGRHVTVLMYNGTKEDGNMTNDGEVISSFALCYGLVPEVTNSRPILSGDNQVAIVGETLDFEVIAEDDGKPVDPLDSSYELDFSIVSHTILDFYPDDNDSENGTFAITGTDTRKTGTVTWTPTAADAGKTYEIIFTAYDGELSTTLTLNITVDALVVTPSCKSLNIDSSGNNKLDETGISCPVNATNDNLVCNFELGVSFYGLVDSDSCCICHSDGTATPLTECDPAAPAGTTGVTGLQSCLLADKSGLPAGEVTTHIEFNNDPYYCTTYQGTRKCYPY